MSTRVAVAASLAALLVSTQARAVPRVLGYEGRLIMGGDPATGTPQVTFAIYDAPTGGNQLWSEQQTLALTSGFYATYLGTVNGFPDNLFDGTDRYLELTVNGETLTPRQRISAVAYAMRSDIATSVSGGPVNATSLSVNGVPLVDSSGHLTGAASYSAGSGISIDATNTISLTTSCASGQVLEWSGTAWACTTPATGGGGIASVTVAAGTPITVANSSSAPQLSMSPASSTLSGYLAASDWTTFNSKLGASSSAGGDISGNFSGLTVKGLQGAPVSSAAATSGQVLKWNGTQWAPAADLNSGGTVTQVSAATGTPITVANSSSTPQLSMSQASSTLSGYLASSDWAAFNAKLGTTSSAGGDVSGNFSSLTVKGLQGAPVNAAAAASGQVLKWDGSEWSPATDANSGGTVTAVSAASGTPITVSNANSTPQLSMAQASSTLSGYLAASDWTAFNAKLGTTSGAGGDVSGNFSSLTVKGLQGAPVSSTAAASGQVLKWNGTQWAPGADDDAGGTVTSVGVASGTPITVNNASSTPQLSMSQASSTLSGYLAASDWTAFNAKLGATSSAGGDVSGNFSSLTVKGLQGAPVSSAAATSGQVLKWSGTQWAPGADNDAGGTVTSVGVASGTPITVNNASSTPQLSMSQASSTLSGYLAASDWTAFSAKLGATSNAGGDVSGNFSNLTVKALQGAPVSAAAATSGQVLKWDGAQWSPAADANSGGTVTQVSAASGTPITVSNASSAPQLSMSQASASSSGYLSSTDWSNFNSKFGASTTVGVSNGGTGAGSFTPNAVLLGNGTNAVASVSGTGATGQVLTSSGPGSAPTWQSPATQAQITLAQSGGLAWSGSAGNGLELAASGVTPGSYTNASLSVDGSGRLIAVSSGSNSVNASQILSVPVNDAAKTDGYVLSFSAANNQIVYVPNAANGNLPASANVAWTSSSSGDLSCTLANAVCVTATSGGASVGCSEIHGSGQASCRATVAADGWTTHAVDTSSLSMGDMMCGATNTVCVSLERTDGVSYPCNTSVNGSSYPVIARCRPFDSSDTWSQMVTWTDQYQTGIMACAAHGLDCDHEERADGYNWQCTVSDVGNAGTMAAFCKPRSGAWDNYVTWLDQYQTGRMACATVNEDCLAEYRGDGYAWTCDVSDSASSYMMSALCTPKAASGDWDQVVTWLDEYQTGERACAQIGEDCIHEYRSDGYSWSCDVADSASSYRMVAFCQKHTAAWDNLVSWSNSNQTGQIACEQIGQDCLETVRVDGYTWTCDVSVSGASYKASAFCTPRNSTVWNALATWTVGNNTGDAACAAMNMVCVDGMRQDGYTYPCQTDVSGSAGNLATARCRTPASSDLWNQAVPWTVSDNTGEAACTTVGEACVRTVRQDGYEGNCTTDINGTSYAAYALCRPLTTADAWTINVNWTGLSGTGSANCANIGKSCIAAYNADTGANVACGSTAVVDGTARCQ